MPLHFGIMLSVYILKKINLRRKHVLTIDDSAVNLLHALQWFFPWPKTPRKCRITSRLNSSYQHLLLMVAEIRAFQHLGCSKLKKNIVLRMSILLNMRFFTSLNKEKIFPQWPCSAVDFPDGVTSIYQRKSGKEKPYTWTLMGKHIYIHIMQSQDVTPTIKRLVPGDC